MFWVQILPPLPSPHFFLFFLILYNTFLYIVQYLLFLVHITIPHITPYPQHCVHIHPPTNPTPPPPPPDSPTRPPFFFLNFHKIFNSSFSSTLTPPPIRPPRPDPPSPPQIFFFNFHKNFTSPFPPPPPKKKKKKKQQKKKTMNFYKNFNSSFTSTLTPPTRRGEDRSRCLFIPKRHRYRPSYSVRPHL